MIDNKNVTVNIAYQNKWKLVCHRLPGIEFHCKSVEFPSISLQPIQSNTPVGKFHVGGKIIDYGQFTFNFQIDEKFLNYQTIFDWMVGISGSIDITKYKELVMGTKEITLLKDQHNIYTDATLVSLTNSMNSETEFLIRNMFPINLSAPTFSFDTDQPNTASVTFQTDYYEIVTKNKIS